MKAFSSHPHWSAVESVCRALREDGKLAYLAGGCVRDALMGRAPNDFDVATDARPERVEQLFPNSLPVGKAFGVVIVPFPGFQVEIATFRKDGEYVDGRRPESVDFCTPEDDAKRRDFTVNALFYDFAQDRVLDFVGGEADVRAKLIRAVGRPEARFQEDKLRLLRAVRFAAQLGFAIEPDTWAAVRRLAAQANAVSAERVREELSKWLKAPPAGRAEGLRLLRDSGLLEATLPEVAAALAMSPEALPRAMRALEALEKDEGQEALWAAVLFPATGAGGSGAARAAQQILLRLKPSSRFAEDVAWTLAAQETLWLPDDLRVADAAIALADPRAPAAERLQLALAKAAGEEERAERAVRKRMAIRLRFLEKGALPAAFLNGADLKALGEPPGPRMGELLKEAFRLQIEHRLNTREEALEWADEQIGPRPNVPGSGRA